jgi:hypothetical protein
MPSFKSRTLRNVVKVAMIDPKSARDEEIFSVFKRAIWEIHESLLTHIPRTITEDIIRSEADAILEMKRYINEFHKRKPLKEKITFKMMERITDLFNGAVAFAATVTKIYKNRNQSGSRILYIYQLCDQLREIFDFLEGNIECASLDLPITIKCSFEPIIRINYRQEAIIVAKMNKLQIADDAIKFCFCKDSILRWHRMLSGKRTELIKKPDIDLFERSITELKSIIESIHYHEPSIGNKLKMLEINNILNIAASQIGEAATIYESKDPSEILRCQRLLADFTDQLAKLHECLKLSKIDCPKVLP